MARNKTKFIHKPVYPGGMKAIRQFIKSHLQYPEAALAKGTEGTVKVDYSLNQSGKVIKAKATEGPGDGCREEAVRLVKLLRFDVPKDYKMTVQYHLHLDVVFKLPQAKPKVGGGAPRIQYQIKPSEAKPASPTPAKPESGGYTYTIKW